MKIVIILMLQNKLSKKAIQNVCINVPWRACAGMLSAKVTKGNNLTYSYIQERFLKKSCEPKDSIVIEDQLIKVSSQDLLARK